MKNILITLVFILYMKNATSQVLQYEWGRCVNGYDDEETVGATIDKFGNVYTVGYFYDSVDCDPGPAISMIYADGVAFPDIFVMKYNVYGDFIWAKRFGNSSVQNTGYLGTDSIGNLYCAFHCGGDSIDLDPGPGSYLLYPYSNDFDIFIVKLDPNGDFVWAKQLGGNPAEVISCMDVDDQGNIYTTGLFRYTSDFDPSISTYNLTSSGSYEAFISKLNSDGNFVWAKKIGGVGADRGLGIITDNLGNVYTTGVFNNTVDFDPNAGVQQMTGSDAAFVLKLSSSGNYIWAKSFDSNVIGNSIGVDAQYNVYTSGKISIDSVDFDPGPGTYYLDPPSQRNVYVSKLSSLGNFVYAKVFPDSSLLFFNNMVVSPDGNLYLTGTFKGLKDFDSSINTYMLSSIGSTDAYLLKLDNNGNLDWVQQFGWHLGIVDANALELDNFGNIYAMGNFKNAIDLNPSNLDSALFFTNTNYDGYTVKLSTLLTDIDANKNKTSNISLYPNPTGSALYIQSQGNLLPHQIKVYTINGANIPVEINHNTINTSNLASGLYFIQIANSEGVEMIKFIKE
jgi:hypothetical protein